MEKNSWKQYLWLADLKLVNLPCQKGFSVVHEPQLEIPEWMGEVEGSFINFLSTEQCHCVVYYYDNWKKCWPGNDPDVSGFVIRQTTDTSFIAFRCVYTGPLESTKVSALKLHKHSVKWFLKSQDVIHLIGNLVFKLLPVICNIL